MSLQIKESVNLLELTTLGIPATARYLIHITNTDQLSEAIQFANSKQLPIFILGGGSNVVLGQPELECVVLKIELKGLDVIESDNSHTLVRVAAGEVWDELVQWSIKHDLRGIESMSIVPGTVGAAPVQNVGCYGQEVSETITEVEVFNRETGKIETLTNSQCKFAYRDSIFKHEGKSTYIVTAVSFQLVPSRLAPPPTYSSLQTELGRRGITRPTLSDIREALITVRNSKLPNPYEIPTVGSFFHNPIVPTQTFQKLQRNYPELPHWPAGGSREKLSAPWLVEQCGLKGHMEDGVGIYDKQAIVVINPGHKSAAEVLAFRDQVLHAVKEKFGITLNMEPELIRF